jgi:hypothetical protein
VAKKIIDLDNYVQETPADPDGRLKNQVYSGATVTEVGSKVLADYVQDALTPFLWLLRQAGGTPSGVADTQADSQYIDALVAKIEGIAGRDAIQQGLSNFREDQINYAPGVATWSSVNSGMTYGDNRWLASQFLGGTGMLCYRIWAARSQSATVHADGAYGDRASNMFYSNGNFILFENAKNNFPALYCHTSPDGITWTPRVLDSIVSNTEMESKAIGKVGNTLVAVLYCSTVAQPNRASTSNDDGLSWSKNTTTGLPDYVVCAAHNDTTMIVGGSNGASYSTDGITWTAITGLVGQNITQAVYNGKRFLLFTDSSSCWISNADDSLIMQETTLSYSSSNVNSCTVSNGVTIAYDPVDKKLMSLTQKGAEDSVALGVSGPNYIWRVHPFPFPVTGGAIITNNFLIAGDDEQLAILGNTLDAEAIAITPPIQR